MQQFKQRTGQAGGFTYRDLWPAVVVLAALLAWVLKPYYTGQDMPAAQVPAVAEKRAIQQLQLAEKDIPDNRANNDAPYNPATGGGGAVRSARYYRFNPNTATAQDWQNFGLSDKQAGAIIKYVARGGRFKQPQDMRKLYTLSPEKYTALLPYAVIGAAPAAVPGGTVAVDRGAVARMTTPAKAAARASAAVVVDLNTADTAQLMQVKGIGPFYAREIVKLRNKLGAFVAAGQLTGIYNVTPERLAEWLPQLKLTPGEKKMVDINRAGLQQVLQFPLLSYKQANALVNYRTQHGAFKNAAALKEVVLIDDATLEKITPYLNFE